MKVVFDTAMTQIGDDRRIKPKSALWQIFNDGNTDVILNGNLTIKPNDTFGIDATNVFTIAKDVEVENDTEFDVRFGVFVQQYSIQQEHKSCQLVETTFKIIS